MPLPNRRGVTDAPAKLALACLFASAALGLGAPGCDGKVKEPAGAGEKSGEPAESAQSARVELDVFAFGRMLGAIAPCGCTTEPLGGLAFAFGYIETESTPGARVVLEPGSFLYPDPTRPEYPTDEAGWAQAERRAKLLQTRFSALGEGLVSGLGPTDFASPAGAAALGKHPLPRVLTNAEGRPEGVAASTRVELAPKIHAQVAVIVEPELIAAITPEGWPAMADPQDALAGLSVPDDTDLRIVVVHGSRGYAQELAKQVPEWDLWIAGGELHDAQRSREGSPPIKVGDAWVLEPGDQAQTISHLSLSVPKDTLATGELPAVSTWTVVPSQDQVRQELARVEERIRSFASDPNADPSFVKGLERERDRLKASLESSNKDAKGVVARFEQVKVSCKLPPDADAKQALKGYDAAVAAENKKRFAGVAAPAVAKGQAHYVGVDECANCHDEAAEFWESTIHARAYDTLVDANKQFDLSCVGCHVTGFREPGGSEVVENAGLTSVQCEQCHGAGSAHADDPDVALETHAPANVCVQCHTPEHSDTFEYEAYLRDILGEGHGAAARQKLGPGKTGHELRAAGLEKAGGACPKTM